MRIILINFFLFLVISACTQQAPNSSNEAHARPMQLSLDQSNQLANLPLNCVQKKYPFMIFNVLNSIEDVKEPQLLYPAFYGCFDWHSAVHGHWSLVKLLKEYPNIEKADLIETILRANISAENIQAEAQYFSEEKNKSFERTYGWAWLLKLAEELHTWDSPLARDLEQNLNPLTQIIVNRFIEYLPKLTYPIRVGTHSNTAFALSFAYDFAIASNNNQLLELITSSAVEYYYNDLNCPIEWEPSGNDFLSPCFEEIQIMRKILNKQDFDDWIEEFMPQLKNPDFNIEVALVSDRSDGHLVHLDGLNFSRAWVFYGLAKQYEEYAYLVPLANAHLQHSLPNIFSDTYEGGHWLGSFAIYALSHDKK